MNTVWMIVIALVMNIAAHEGGHFISALILKLHPHFAFEWSLSPIKVLWDITTDKNNRIVTTSGFGCQIATLFILIALLGTAGAWVDKTFLLCYSGILTVHFCSYPFRMKGVEANDFNGMDSDEDRSN